MSMSLLKRIPLTRPWWLALLTLISFASQIQAEVVTIPDANLRAAIETALGKFPGDPITDAEMATLTNLSAYNKNISELTGLEYATSIEILILFGNKITDLSPLSTLEHLQNLKVTGNPVADLSPLSGLSNLQRLSVGYSDITDLSPLSNLTSLWELDLDFTPIDDFTPIRHLTNLQVLRLYHNSIPDISFLSGLTLLQTLDLSYNQIADISYLANCINLQDLNLEKNNISDLTGLESGTLLKWLNLSRNPIQNLSPLSNLESLRELDLRGAAISDLSPLSGLESLPLLNLSSNAISNISPLSSLASLRDLNLEDNDITDTSPLASLTNLQVLNLKFNQITDVSLGSLSNLEELELSENSITDISGLSELTSLKVLNLLHNEITDISPISNLPNLNYLRLHYNKIGSLPSLDQLEQLDLLAVQYNYIDISQGSEARIQVIDPLIEGGCDVGYTPQYDPIPDIEITPNPIILYGSPGDALSTQFTIANAGLGNMDWFARASAEWVLLHSISGTIIQGGDATVVVSIDPVPNHPAPSTATITLISNDPDNHTSEIPIEVRRIIDIPDENLKGALGAALGKDTGDLITDADMATLVNLNANNMGISDLTGLEFAQNLTSLDLSGNQISDISPLFGISYSVLYLQNNYLDVSDGTIARTLVIDPLLTSGADVIYLPQNNLPPETVIIPEALVIAGNPGTSISHTISIENPGRGALSWSASTSDLWISINPESGIIPSGSGFSLQVSINSIPDYTNSLSGAITFSSNDPTSPTLNIPVNVYPPIDIPDTNLLEALNQALGAPTGSGVSAQQLATLTELNAGNLDISDISGLEYAGNLTVLNLSNNQISDISPLAALTGLTHLYLYNNKLTDIAALAGLDQLEVLRIYNNYLDISAGSEPLAEVIVPLIAEGAEVAYTPQLKSEIEIAPETIVLVGNPGDALSAGINIENTGPNDLVWSIHSDDAWISADPATGIITSGSNASVMIHIDPVPEFSGAAMGNLTINSNDADTPVVNIPVEVHAPIDFPDMALLSAIEEALGLEPGSPIIAPYLTTLTYLDASNLGITDLTGLEYATNLLSLNLQDNLIDISDGSDARVLVIDPLIAGGANVVYSPQRAPELIIDPVEFVFVGEPGDNLSFSISVGNTGELDLIWSISEAPEWISIDPLSGTISPAGSESISLSIESVPAFVGSLTGSIVLESNDPYTPSVTVTVEVYPPIVIPDPNLRAAVEDALGLDPGSPIIAPQIAELTTLNASDHNIVDLTGIEHAVNLVSLDLENNFITDLAPLLGLVSLDQLDVRVNLLDIQSGSTDRDIIDQLNDYAAVKFAPQRYPMQAFHNFLTECAIPPGQDGFLDKNGPLEIPNLMAFAMGIDPMTAPPDMLPMAVRDAETGASSFCFHRNLAAMDVELLIEASEDLKTWEPVPPEELTILSDEGDGQQYVEAAFGEEGQYQFLRLRAVSTGQ